MHQNVRNSMPRYARVVHVPLHLSPIHQPALFHQRLSGHRVEYTKSTFFRVGKMSDMQKWPSDRRPEDLDGAFHNAKTSS